MFMCLYWLVIKLGDSEHNTAELRIAATQSAERYRQACAAAELWRERAIAAQDSAAAETQRTFTLITEKGCAVRAAAAAEQRLAIERAAWRAGRARAAAAVERAAVEASAATAELAAVKANAAATERATAKVRREASLVLANEPIERKRAIERAVAANDEAYWQTYSILSREIIIGQRKYNEERLAQLECMESRCERQSDYRDQCARETASLSAGSAADQLRARAAASKVCADQAAKNAIIMAASAERATAVANTLATVVSLTLPGLDMADLAVAFRSAVADASDAAEISAIDAEYAAAEASEARTHAEAAKVSAAAEASAAVETSAAVEASAAAVAERTTIKVDAGGSREGGAVAKVDAGESWEGEPFSLELETAGMFVEVAVLAEVCISPLAGPLPESLRGLANRGGMTGMLLPAASTAAMAERTAIEASAADAERAAVEASAAAVAERAAIEASAADAERAAVEASAAAVAERAAIEASAADAERAAVEASAAAVAERAAIEASAADAERATLEASAAAVAVERADSIKVCGQRASRRGARGGRRAVTRRRSVSCIPPNPIPLVVMLAHEGSRLHRGGKGEPGGIGASEGPSPLAHLTWEGSSHPLAQ
jgi:hypothetical protein